LFVGDGDGVGASGGFVLPTGTVTFLMGEAADSVWEEGGTLAWREAVAYAERARGEHARPRHGWASLTPTEQRVVELVMAGQTNPEIAERLLMSRGTVKTHLEHVFAKTGCRNRAEVAVAALRQQQRT
jgi:DNA-binding CsgD family transcriptional regulator